MEQVDRARVVGEQVFAEVQCSLSESLAEVISTISVCRVEAS